MMSRSPPSAAVVVALCAAGALACSKPPPAPLAPLPAPLAVAAHTVALRPMPRILALAGALHADQQADIAANVAGTVVALRTERGQAVAAGGPLVEIDRRGANLSEQEARANLETAEAQERLANQQCQRNRMLLERGAISRDEWDRVDNQCHVTLAAAKAARARANISRKSLGDATVRAPFSGTVFERFVNLGEYVQPSTPVITLVSLAPLRLAMTVAEADIGQVSLGQRVEFTTEAFGSERFAGAVTIVDPALRAATRDLRLEARVDDPTGRLRPGMSAEAQLVLPDAPRPAVPAAAVRGAGLQARVFALQSGRLAERRVLLGLARDGMVEVLDGVAVGDTIAAEVSAAMRDGLPVIPAAG